MISTLVLLATLSAPSLDVIVDGEGYFRFLRDGRAVYSKSAKLTITEGKLTDSEGDPILPSIQINSEAIRIDVDLEGNVFATCDGAKIKAGQLVLAQFSSPASLEAKGSILIASEKPHLGNPGDDAMGVVRTEGAPKTATTVKAESVSKQVAQSVIPPSLERKIIPAAAQASRTANQVVKSLRIIVDPHPLTSGDHIYLSDIAKIEGDPTIVDQISKIDLGDTPPIGVARKIDRQRVVLKLTLAGVQPPDYSLDMSNDTDVRRKGQTVQSTEFVTMAVQAILDKNGPTGSWASTDNYGDMEVPNGKVELRAESMSGMQSGEASVSMAVYVAGNRFNSRTVHLHLKDQIPPLRIGSAVKVIMLAGRAEVEVPGIVKTSGKLGDSIQVEVRIGNPPVSTFHTALVVGPGVVQVKL